MINRTRQSGQETTYLTEFTVDKESEINDLPVFPEVAKGSLCLIVENCAIYILNGENTWVLLEGGSGGGGFYKKEITSATIADNNHFVIHFSDGSSQDCGEIYINTITSGSRWSMF